MEDTREKQAFTWNCFKTEFLCILAVGQGSLVTLGKLDNGILLGIIEFFWIISHNSSKRKNPLQLNKGKTSKL